MAPGRYRDRAGSALLVGTQLISVAGLMGVHHVQTVRRPDRDRAPLRDPAFGRGRDRGAWQRRSGSGGARHAARRDAASNAPGRGSACHTGTRRNAAEHGRAGDDRASGISVRRAAARRNNACGTVNDSGATRHRNNAARNVRNKETEEAALRALRLLRVSVLAARPVLLLASTLLVARLSPAPSVLPALSAPSALLLRPAVPVLSVSLSAGR